LAGEAKPWCGTSSFTQKNPIINHSNTPAHYSLPHLAVAHDKKVDAVARRDKAARVEHQRLVDARLVGLFV
jgi:hypothetical protein